MPRVLLIFGTALTIVVDGLDNQLLPNAIPALIREWGLQRSDFTTALAIDRGFLPPTINVTHLDPACDMDVLPNVGRAAEIDAALCNCLGFGSKNSAVVVGRVQ